MMENITTFYSPDFYLLCQDSNDYSRVSFYDDYRSLPTSLNCTTYVNFIGYSPTTDRSLWLR